jgi:predicted lipoprotein with Yx(FWY)xxD motif
MTRTRCLSTLTAAATVLLAALGVAGCGGSDGGTGSAAPPQASAGRPAALGVTTAGSLGKVLVDARGRTLYAFEKDRAGRSACTGACAAAWPPLRVVGDPVVGAGLAASKVASASRSDGGPELTYDGHPLYRFSRDRKPGDTHGQGLREFGGRWSAVSPTGEIVTGSTGSGGGYGY